MRDCFICGNPGVAAYKNPEDPEQRLCRACLNRLKRRARGLQRPGPKPDPTKLRSRYNPDNPRRLKSPPENRRRSRSDPATYESCVRGHPLVPGEDCRACRLIYNRRRYYGVEPEFLEQLAVKQQYLCGVCQKPFIEMDREPDLDHDHTTGKVRGIVCRKCNGGLGMLGDTLESLQRAIAYLQNPPGG